MKCKEILAKFKRRSRRIFWIEDDFGDELSKLRTAMIQTTKVKPIKMSGYSITGVNNRTSDNARLRLQTTQNRLIYINNAPINIFFNKEDAEIALIKRLKFHRRILIARFNTLEIKIATFDKKLKQYSKKRK